MSTQLVTKRQSESRFDTDPFQTFFDSFFGRPALSRPFEGMAAALDVVETDEALLVNAAMPGVKPEDVDVTIEGRALTIRGETAKDEEHKDAKVYRREIARGSYSRTVRLPEGLDTSKVSASIEDGLVRITLPWSEDRKPPVVKVPVSPAKN